MTPPKQPFWSHKKLNRYNNIWFCYTKSIQSDCSTLVLSVQSWVSKETLQFWMSYWYCKSWIMYETGHTQWCMAHARLHGERDVIEAKTYRSQKPMRPGRNSSRVTLTWQSVPYPARLVPTLNVLPQLQPGLLQLLWPHWHSATFDETV